jgi:hypothetical protein
MRCAPSNDALELEGIVSAMALTSISSVSMISGAHITPAWHIRTDAELDKLVATVPIEPMQTGFPASFCLPIRNHNAVIRLVHWQTFRKRYSISRSMPVGLHFRRSALHHESKTSDAP